MTTETKEEVEELFQLKGLSPVEATVRLLNQPLGDTAEEEHLLEVAEDWISTYFPPHPTQDEAVQLLEAARNASWDIPSILGTICQHQTLTIYNDFPMHHRNWADPNDYPNLRDYVEADNGAWDLIDQHFKEVHHIDLTDERINWSFDT